MTDCSSQDMEDVYFALNHGCLDDVDKFSDSVLKRIAKSVGISSTGEREELVAALCKWHRSFNVRPGCSYDVENQSPQSGAGALPYRTMSATASNFHLLEVTVGSPTNKETGVDPALLSPLIRQPRKRKDGTPVGILSPSKGQFSLRKHLKKRKLDFSVLNGVKLIPPRPQTIRALTAPPLPPPSPRYAPGTQPSRALSSVPSAPSAAGLPPTVPVSQSQQPLHAPSTVADECVTAITTATAGLSVATATTTTTTTTAACPSPGGQTSDDDDDVLVFRSHRPSFNRATTRDEEEDNTGSPSASVTEMESAPADEATATAGKTTTTEEKEGVDQMDVSSAEHTAVVAPQKEQEHATPVQPAKKARRSTKQQATTTDCAEVAAQTTPPRRITRSAARKQAL